MIHTNRVIDNFLDDPDRWRRVALNVRYYHFEGEWSRTDAVRTIAPALESEFTYTLMNKVPEFKSGGWYSYGGRFQWIYKPGSIGQIHSDDRSGKTVTTAIIYLNPDADPDSGTSLMERDASGNFKEIQRVDNYYNRLFIFPGNILHRANKLYCNNDKRLVFVYFIFYNGALAQMGER